MSSVTEYVFNFDSNGKIERIPRARWNRIREGKEPVKGYANKKVYIPMFIFYWKTGSRVIVHG